MSSALPMPHTTGRFAVRTRDGETFALDALHAVHALRLALTLLEREPNLAQWTLCNAADGSLLAWSNSDDQDIRIQELRTASRAAA